MAVTEKEIQLYIWGLKDKWKALIEPVDFPESVSYTEAALTRYAVKYLAFNALMLYFICNRK
jgi:hypothetical protein